MAPFLLLRKKYRQKSEVRLIFIYPVDRQWFFL